MTQLSFPFIGAFGDELEARLDLPNGGDQSGYLLFAHCFTGSKDVLAAVRIAKALWLRKFAVFRFDFTGLGESDGDFANTTFSSNVDDLIAAAGYLRNHHKAPSILIGHSLGGAAVLSASVELPEVGAVCTIGAPSDPHHVEHHFSAARPEIEATGEAEVSIGGRPFRIKKSFLDDIADHKLTDKVARMKKALLVFHSPIDDVVGIENAAEIYKAAKHPKSFVSLDKADHLVTKREDAYYVAEVVSAWADRYIG